VVYAVIAVFTNTRIAAPGIFNLGDPSTVLDGLVFLYLEILRRVYRPNVPGGERASTIHY